MNMPEQKETKAQRVERLKRELNPWLHLDAIRDFARRGHDSIPPEWLSTYFRPWGVYTQGDGLGVTGGKGGEGRAVPFFMVRIRIPNGLLTSRQLHAIAELSDRHGNGVADITVRQNIQLHWVRIESLPEVFDQLHAVGLSTTGACGDVARNITGCPLAGLDAREIADVSPIALAIDKELAGNPDFYNLPRKFKITVTSCPDWCSYPEINDIALTATLRPSSRLSPGSSPVGVEHRSTPSWHGVNFIAGPPSISDQGTFHQGTASQSADKRPSRHSERSLRSEESLFSSVSTGASPLAVPGRWSPLAGRPSSTNHESRFTNHDLGFSLRVAGGLSTEPHLAVRLNAFIRQDQVIPVVRAITEVFRESQVLRQSRDRARLKYLFLEHGWTPASFLAAIEQRLGYSLDPAEPEDLPSQIHRDHLGVQAQKQPGLFSVGASVIRGRISPAQLRLAAGLAERFADGHIRTTPMQNLLLVNIPEAHVPAVVSALVAGGLPVESSPFVRGTVACTGS